MTQKRLCTLFLACFLLCSFFLYGDTWAQDSPQPGDTWVEPVTGMEFIWVQGGEFEMGQGIYERMWLFMRTGFDGDAEFSVERPKHKVKISGFWMGKREVTNKEYRLFRPDHDSGDFEGHDLNADELPVVQVDWNDAAAFAAWLSKQGSGHFRLPSEAQWEYAARAGKSDLFTWGDDPIQACKYANVADITSGNLWPDWVIIECDDGHATATPGGTFPPNGFGFEDMAGNVWEYCQDQWQDDTYALQADNAPVVDPLVAPKEGQRIVRGGSWADFEIALRTAYRRNYTVETKDEVIGFRLVRLP